MDKYNTISFDTANNIQKVLVDAFEFPSVDLEHSAV